MKSTNNKKNLLLASERVAKVTHKHF